MGEESNVQCPQKTSLGHLRAVKQLPTVAFDLKRRRVDPEAFQSIQLDICMTFYVSKQVVKSQNDRDTWSNVEHSFKQ